MNKSSNGMGQIGVLYGLVRFEHYATEEQVKIACVQHTLDGLEWTLQAQCSDGWVMQVYCVERKPL